MLVGRQAGIQARSDGGGRMGEQDTEGRDWRWERREDSLLVMVEI